MKIVSAEFVKSAFDRSHWITDDKPEIAFLGRSNVGKSSLINSMLRRKALARTSNTPGRTQSLNYFLINDSFYFVDLPGYGYARVSKTTKQDWGVMAREYLTDQSALELFIQLIDSRHEPTALDRQLNDWLQEYAKPHIIVATKADKPSARELRKSQIAIRTIFSESEVLEYSAVSGKGRDELWAVIGNVLKK